MGKKNNVISLPYLVTNLTLLKLSHEVKQLEEQQKKVCEMSVKTILKALDCRDHYTYGHSMRVAYYSTLLGEELGLSTEELYDLELSALFHDIGKIGTPDSVLLKPSRLNEDEFLIMKKHPEHSGDILKEFNVFEGIATYVRHHHERFDGRGYPDGLKGEEIPYFSRIILIADTFDAMTSSRPYRKGLDYEVAFQELSEFSGTQFDPKLVKSFIKAMKKEANKKEDTFYLQVVGEHFKKNAA